MTYVEPLPEEPPTLIPVDRGKVRQVQLTSEYYSRATSGGKSGVDCLLHGLYGVAVSMRRFERV